MDNPLLTTAGVAALREAGVGKVDVAVVLGSGWSSLLASLDIDGELSYDLIPGMPEPTVSGHPGRCVWVQWGGRRCLIFAGRFHCYEALSLDHVTRPVELAHALGCKTLLLTCAAGGLSPTLSAGDLVAIKGHLEWDLGSEGSTELSVPSVCTEPYATENVQTLCESGRDLGLATHRGVLASVLGPNYETGAETQMLSGFGADVVSMSTAPEAMRAARLGVEVAALACVTNVASVNTKAESPVKHEDVVDVLRSRQKAIGGVIGLWLERQDS